MYFDSFIRNLTSNILKLIVKSLGLVFENSKNNRLLKQVFKVDIFPLQIKSRRWDFNLDIAAPQIIMPESFSDQNTILVVFDLGRLQFHNLQSTPTSPTGISEENDGLFIILYVRIVFEKLNCPYFHAQ